MNMAGKRGVCSRLIAYSNISHFRLDVVYKMGGILMGHYGTWRKTRGLTSCDMVQGGEGRPNDVL